MTIPLESVGERMWGWQMTAWNRDFLLVVFINPCQQIVRQMPDHLPKVKAFRNSADTDGLDDFFVGGFSGFLKETTVCKWWTSCATNLSVKSAKWRRRWVFLKLFCFFLVGKWILKAKQMPLSPTGGPMGRSLEQVRQDIVRYRGELARCADLLAFQLGKEP